MTTLQTLIDELDIRHGLARFARILDHKQWDTLGEVFADDLDFDYGSGGEQHGLDALREQMRRYLDVCGGSQHLLGSIRIEVNGDRAVSHSYVQARHQGIDSQTGKFFDSNGRYIDHWQRRAQGWRIVRRDSTWYANAGDPAVIGMSGAGNTLDDTAKLLAIREIETLKARYFRCMDSKDWVGLEAVFTPDVLTDFRESVQPRDESRLIEGAARYVATLAPILEPLSTVHHGHMAEIELTSATTATGIWAMEDKLWAPEGSGMPWRRLHGYGHYHERYEKHDGRWYISSIRLSRLRVDVESSA